MGKRKTMLPWMGGKSKLAPAVIARLPQHHTYVEAFTGGGAVFWQKPKSPVEIINDKDGRLVTLYRIFRHHPDELLRHLRWLLHARDDFATALDQPGETDIQRAAKFLFVLKSCFGGRATSPTFGTSKKQPAGFSKADVEDLIGQAHTRLQHVTIENLDFEDLLERYDSKETVFYCDPPYIDTAGYAESFGVADHIRLRDRLDRLQGAWLVSLNDCDRVRDLYRRHAIDAVTTKYTVGKNKSTAGDLVGEVIICPRGQESVRAGGLFSES